MLVVVERAQYCDYFVSEVEEERCNAITAAHRFGNVLEYHLLSEEDLVGFFFGGQIQEQLGSLMPSDND